MTKKPLTDQRDIYKIVGVYAACGFLWILASDTVVGLFVDDQKITIQIAILKGSVFIIVTSLLLYILIKLFHEKTITSEKAAIASEERFELLFQRVADPIYITDTKGKIIEANDQACRELGYTLAEILRLNISEVDTNAGENDFFAANRPPQANRALTFETTHQRKDGSLFPVDLNVCLIDLAGQQAVMEVARKITKRKKAEQELRQSYELMNYIIKYNTSALAVHDKDLKYLFVSERYLNDYKVKERDVIGKHHYDVFPDLPQKWRDAHQQALAGITSRAENDRYDKADGSVDWTTWECRPWYESNGAVGGVVIYTEIVTDRIMAEEQKQLLQQQLHQAQKMEAIGTLAGGIAHDFNNILCAIIGYAELAEGDSAAGSSVKKDIEQVLKASHRAKDLVKQILAFSRQVDTERVPVQPAVIINEAIMMLRSSLPTTITIQQDIDQESVYVLADPTQIHQILMNLCTNAFHAMEETGGTLSISLKKKFLYLSDFSSELHVQPGDFLQLSIADTGSGISPDIQKKIFDPFFTTKEVGKGTGMGLSVTHGIVKSYGGFVTFDSKPGEGTVFHVHLPAITDTAQHETKSSDLIPVGSEHILFIDDEEILTEMGKHLLEKLGYRVTVRKSSIEALSTFQGQPDQFDLVITDQTMPGMTGFDLARRLLQIRPELPIILCTGYSSQVSEEKVRSYGIKGFIMKPLAKKDIAHLIRKVVDGDLTSGEK